MNDLNDDDTKTEGSKGSNSTSFDEKRFHSSTANSGVTKTFDPRVPDSGAILHCSGRDGAAKHWFEKESLLKFVTPCSISLIGMSSSGKSRYIRKMLEQADGMFTEAPSRVIYCYNVFQKLFTKMSESVPDICFYQGLPDRGTIASWASDERHLLLIFYYLYQELIQSKAVCDLTIMLSHHLNISCIMTSHNIFMCSKYSNTISTNLHYILLFTIRNRLQLSVLGGQLFCHKSKAKNFVKVYDIVNSENCVGNPLVIDNSPRSTNRQYMLRSNVLPGELPIIYDIN